MATTTAPKARGPLTAEEASANLQSQFNQRTSAPPADGGKARAKASNKDTPAGHRKGDRWAAFNQFVDGSLRDTSEAELRVWLVLFRDVRNGLARTGMTDIAKRAGLSRRGVVKAVAGLKRRRLIEVVARGSVNGSPNVYRVHGTDLVNRHSLPLVNPEGRT